jgi:hypothetical protein
MKVATLQALAAATKYGEDERKQQIAQNSSLPALTAAITATQ